MTTEKAPWLGVLAESVRLVTGRLEAAARFARPAFVRAGSALRPVARGARRILVPVGNGARSAGQRVRGLAVRFYHSVATESALVLVQRTALYVVLPLFAFSFLLYSNCGFDGCPDVGQLTAYQPGGASVLLDRNGNRFADLAPYERVVVALDSLPEHVPAAFIAVEDRRFWSHHGIDWVRTFGAAWANVRARSFAEGFSTIPMQLARNVFPEDLPGAARTPKRKIEEMRVARMIESHFDKRAILEMYLNHIYFGAGAYGIEAASRLYFGKAATRLSVAEAATLAALPKAPSHYDPRRHPDEAKARRNLVVSLMEEQKLLDPAVAEKARAARLTVKEGTGTSRSGVPLGAYFIDVVRDQLEERFGERLYRTPMRIYTTLDVTAQRAAEKELSGQLQSLQGQVRRGEGELQGAAVVMDAYTGDVLALVGGRDPVTSRYNRAVLGERQLGSSFKPFVYAAALHQGVPTSRVLLDLPLSVQLSRSKTWEPSNYDGEYEGQISLRNALVRSRNVPTVRLASEVGIGNIAATARAAGVSALMDETPALALGTVATSPLQLATAYTTFATLGQTASPRFVVRVDDENGRPLWEPPQQAPVHGMDPRVAYIITDILSDAVDFGTGTGVRSAGFYGPAAGKTGTTNDATDAWFAGYTPELVGVVWIGYDKPSSLGSAATGGGYAAPVWGRIMRQVYQSRPMSEGWGVPAGIVSGRVDPETGYLLQQGCTSRSAGVTSEIFLAESVPPTICPYRDFWADLWGRIRGRYNEDEEFQRPRARPIRPLIRPPSEG